MAINEHTEQMLSYKPDYSRPERILCAAVYYDDGVTRTHRPRNIDSGLVVSAYRHCDCFEMLKEIYQNREYITDAQNRNIQGFLTSYKRFVNRTEAGLIAYKARQLKHYRNGMEIYSEDLY